MSTVKTTYLQHPSSGTANITLKADGTVENVSGMGKVLQVVSTIKQDTFSTTSTSYTTVTSLSLSITPSSATNKVLLLANVSGLISVSTATVGFLSLFRGATNLATATSPSNRTPSFASNILPDGTYQAQNLDLYQMTVLDSPATTSSTTYDVQVRCSSGGNAYVNRGLTDTDAATVPRGVSSLIAFEVAA